MGRKNQFDRRNKGSSHPSHNWEQLQKRGRSRSRSPSPERKRDEISYQRKQQKITETIPRSPSPRGRTFAITRNSPSYTQAQSSVMHGRAVRRSPSLLRRIEDTGPPVEEYRRSEQHSPPVRTQQNIQLPRSRSPSQERNKQKKWKSKKPRSDKKQRHQEREKHKSLSHRQHDVRNLRHNGDASSPPSRDGPISSAPSPPRRSVSPSPRRDRAMSFGNSRGHYKDHPSSYGYERNDVSHPLPQRSPISRYPPPPADGRDVYPRYPSNEYERSGSSGHTIRPTSPLPRRYEDHPPFPKQGYERRDYEQRGSDRPTRPRGQDYNREDWEKAHAPRERYEQPRIPESGYYPDYPEQARSNYEPYGKYPAPPDPRYPDARHYDEDLPRRRTSEGSRAQHEDMYHQQYPYESRRDPYEQTTHPPREIYSRPRSPPPCPPSQYNDTRYDDGYKERYPEQKHIPPLAPRNEIPRGPAHPLPTQDQRNFLPVDDHRPPMSDLPPTGPKNSGGIKPFTLKGRVLRNLKRTREPEPESERIIKSSRMSPRHVNATVPNSVPPSAPVEIQQIQTPETPSNREKEPERKLSTREKGASLFERIGQVGEGTYGKVYKARNTLTGELVALKKIRMEAERDGFPITAMREIKLLESLRHPNIIHLQEMMFEKTFVYMVFEYMDHDLAGILTHPTFVFTPAHIKELLRQMLQGLNYLHHRGILHRDIKGSNILLSASGQLKIADFGLARHYHKRRDNLDYTNRVITLWYRPPELLLGATAYGPAVDIWSIGCIMLEMVMKKALFPGNDEIDQLKKIWDIMGSPTTEIWPKVVELPWWELVKPQSSTMERFHEDFACVLSEQGLDLAIKLLSLDPERRPTALEALQHPYFTKELPRPERPTELVEMDGEWHEFESKQRKRALRAQNQESRRVSPASQKP